MLTGKLLDSSKRCVGTHVVGLHSPSDSSCSQKAEGAKYAMGSSGHVRLPGSLVRRLSRSRIWDHILRAYSTGLIGGTSK